jgi:hypothetical protein
MAVVMVMRRMTTRLFLLGGVTMNSHDNLQHC